MLVAWVLLVNISVVTASRYMAVEPGAYCNSSVISETVVWYSTSRCGVRCQETAQCVAFSQRAGSQCLLHAHFCSSQDLVAEQGSSYANE